jgi:hypothetical protein
MFTPARRMVQPRLMTQDVFGPASTVVTANAIIVEKLMFSVEALVAKWSLTFAGAEGVRAACSGQAKASEPFPIRLSSAFGSA